MSVSYFSAALLTIATWKYEANAIQVEGQPVSDVAYLSGAWIPAEDARLSVFDLGVVGGIAVSEMLRTFRHQGFRVSEHLQRLGESLRLTGLSPRESLADLEQILVHLVDQNTRTLPAENDLGVILFVTAGLNPTYVGQPSAREHGCTVGAHTFPLQFRNWAETYETGVRLAASPVPALPQTITDRRIKSRSRLHWYLADRAVRQVDPSAVALLVNEQQQVTETAAANLCLLRGQTVISPPVGEALEGVSLGMTLELAEALGYQIERRSIPLDELRLAEEIWLTSTPSCLLPVCAWQGDPVGNGRPGSGFQSILKAWSQQVGVDLRAQARRFSTLDEKGPL